MSLWPFMFRDIARRKLNSLLWIFSIAVAAACLSASITLLLADDVRTSQILKAKEIETKLQITQLDEDYQKSINKLDFNVLILPKDQSPADFYDSDHLTKSMSEEHVTRLASSAVSTIQHLLPMLQQKITWPEREKRLILVGTRDEVPKMMGLTNTESNPVQPGTIILGYELSQSLKLNKGDKIVFMGHPLTVAECYKERGNKDDSTAWVDLLEAQQLLGKEGLINGILAQECVCATNNLVKVRAEIEGLLPDTQVIELASQTLFRAAEVRQRAVNALVQSVETEKKERLRFRDEFEEFASLLVPIVMIVGVLWVAFLSWTHDRESLNRIEISSLNQLYSRQKFTVFLGKSVFFGLTGGIIGWAIGFGIGLSWSGGGSARSLFDIKLLIACAVISPILSLLGGWIPASLAISNASQQHPNH